MKRSILTTIVVLITTVCFGQEYHLSDFTETLMPKFESKEWYAQNNSTEYTVALFGSKLIVSKKKYGTIPVVDVPGGELIGINRGEFGGYVYYKAKDTLLKTIYVNGEAKTASKVEPYWLDSTLRKMVSRSSIPIMPANPLMFFNYRDSLYLMAGLAHMGSNDGKIYNINFEKGAIKTSKVLEIDNYPGAMSIFKKRIYLATFSRLYILKDLKIDKVFCDLPWSYMYPNSIAVKNKNTVYIGIRGGYVVFDPERGTLKFFKYNK